MLVGPERVVGLVPVFAPAGVLIAVGSELAYQWLWANRNRQAVGDTIVTWLIVVTAIGVGFVPGILVGLAGGCITFIMRYSRIDAVERRLSGTTLRSRLQRSQQEAQTLADQGKNIRYIALRGYIFFGIADRLYRELFAASQEIEGPGWIVLDFSSVTGMDSSAAGAFSRLLRNVQGDRIRIVFSGMSERVAALWHAALEHDAKPLSFTQSDLAME